MNSPAAIALCKLTEEVVLTTKTKATIRGRGAAPTGYAQVAVKKHRQVHDIHPERKLISRLEASRVLGCSIMTLKRMEKRYGGILDDVKLQGPRSITFYKVEQLNHAFGIDINAPNGA